MHKNTNQHYIVPSVNYFVKASEKTFLISHINDTVFGVTVHSIKLYFTLIPESMGESRRNNSQIHCSWSKLYSLEAARELQHQLQCWYFIKCF